MTRSNELQVLELTGWDTDIPLRPAGFMQAFGPVILQAETDQLVTLFASLLYRQDLQNEFVDLSWHIAVIDLRTLQAFQRRLIIDLTYRKPPAPCKEDWPALTALAFGPPRSTAHNYVSTTTIQSENPDLHLRPSENGWHLHGGSPFFEVALFRGRSFLRDGYHRAFTLLSAGIYAIPAVVIEAHSLAEVCIDCPSFFPESILFGPCPPMVTDFLNPSLTFVGTTPRILKTIHLPTAIRTTKESYS